MDYGGQRFDRDAIYVQPTKLALHFIFAIGLISYAFWFSLKLLFPVTRFRNARWIVAFRLVCLCLVFIQLLFGALMAGNKAAASCTQTGPVSTETGFPEDYVQPIPDAAQFYRE